MVTACPNCMKSFPVDHLDKAFTWEPTFPPAVAGAEDSKPAARTAPAADLPISIPISGGTPAPSATRTAPAAELREPIRISRGPSSPSATGKEHVEPSLKTAPPSALPKPLPISWGTSAPSITGRDHVEPAPRTVPLAALPNQLPSDFDEDSSFPEWVNPWGLAAFSFAVLALLLASLVGVRILTITFSAFGVVVVGLGSRSNRQSKDRIWLALTGTMNGAVLLLALFIPGVINSRWAIDFSVSPGDPNKQVLVTRDYPRDQGRPPSADEWMDATKRAILQEDVFRRGESV